MPSWSHLRSELIRKMKTHAVAAPPSSLGACAVCPQLDSRGWTPMCEKEEAQLAAKRLRGDQCRMLNITQSDSRSGPSHLVPALLCQSQVYSYRKRCCMIPDEHILTQGVNLFSELDCGDPLMNNLIRDAFKQMHPSYKCRFAGNTMHFLCISSASASS